MSLRCSVWRGSPTAGTYVRLTPGATQPESLTISLPVTPTFVYASQGTEVVDQIARHLVLEVGFYDEDLPALVHGIFKIADMFRPEGGRFDPNAQTVAYFPGLAVRGALAGFDDINKDPYRRGYAYVEYSHQALSGEKVLRIEINGLAIPYKGCIERGE